MQHFAVALLFVLVSACATQPPWNKVDYDLQAEAYTNLGMGYLNQGQPRRALLDFRKALDVRPAYSEALHGTALALQEQGEFDLAEKYFKQALQGKGNNTAVRNNYADFLFGQKRYDESLKQLVKASQDIYYSERSTVFVRLGYVSLTLNQLEQAIGYFQQSLAIEPSLIRPHLELLSLRSEQQEWQAAERHWLFLRNAQINDETTLKKALIVVQNTANKKEIRYINSLLSGSN